MSATRRFGAPRAVPGTARPLRAAHKEGSELLRGLRALGCTVALTGGDHYEVRHPSGARLTFAATPRTWRTQRSKVRSWLRRIERGRGDAGRAEP